MRASDGNVKHKEFTHYTPETYRDESNGTTKSKNKLHLTIFHKRMTSWFRKKCESLLRKQVRSKTRSNKRERARNCYFIPHWSWEHIVFPLSPTRSQGCVLMRDICCKKQQSFLWCCFILRLLLLVWHRKIHWYFSQFYSHIHELSASEPTLHQHNRWAMKMKFKVSLLKNIENTKT